MRFSIHPLANLIDETGDFPVDRTDLRLAERLRRSFNSLLARRSDLARVFYGHLFKSYPELRRLFPGDMSLQEKKLLETLGWVVGNLDRPAEVRPVVKQLGAKHVGYGAKPEHYPIVRDMLVQAMRESAGEDWSSDIESDWLTAIDLLSRMMLAGQHTSG